MPLIYAFVAQGNTLLVDYTPSFQGNFNTVALECLQHLQPGKTPRETMLKP
jgi:hypothetical protein